MSQSNKDLYQSINKVIYLLKAAGKFSCAKQLEDALSISTVPSEILGETRIVLEKLACTDFVNNLKVRQEINAILNYINNIL